MQGVVSGYSYSSSGFIVMFENCMLYLRILFLYIFYSIAVVFFFKIAKSFMLFLML